jgi:hypothetical protein
MRHFLLCGIVPLMRHTMVNVFGDEHFHLACAGPLILMNYRGEFRSGDMKRIEALHFQRATLYPEGLIGLSIIEPIQALPGAHARKVANEMMSRTGPTTRAVVLVMLDRGFVVNALSSMAVAVLGLDGRVPVKIFYKVEPALAYIARSHSSFPSAAEMSVMVSAVRQPGNYPTTRPGPPVTT